MVGTAPSTPSPPTDLNERIANLGFELDRTVTHCRRWGMVYHLLSQSLPWIVLLSSAFIVLGGILLKLDSTTLGVLALIPTIAAAINAAIRPHERAAWNFAKKTKLNVLRRRLLFELPDPPSVSDVAQISKAWEVIDLETRSSWEEIFRPNDAAATINSSQQKAQ